MEEREKKEKRKERRGIASCFGF